MTNPIFLAVETGGTKIIARLVRGEHLVAEARWPTGSPDAMLAEITGWVRSTLPPGRKVDAAGLAAFGPLIVDPADARYGKLLSTSKPGWAGSNFRLGLVEALGVPVAADTDVNAAARAERQLGAGRGVPSVAYITVGTGIGAGLSSEHGTLRGALHPEIGHLPLIRIAGDDMRSACSFHDNCAEGLAAGLAVRERLAGCELDDCPDVRVLTAAYIGQLCAAIVLAWSPHRIVLGGGVGTARGVLDGARATLPHCLGNYGVGGLPRQPDFIMPAALENAGLEGALLMARELLCDAPDVSGSLPSAETSRGECLPTECPS